MSTIECTYIFNASTLLKNISIIFYRTQHHLVEMDKSTAQFGNRKSGIHARVLSQTLAHGNNKNT